jgi:aspartate/methionine/tyrosine aminotransferase
VAFGLQEPGDWFETMPTGLQRSRDRLAAGLREAGFVVLDSGGTYFLNVDLKASGIDEDDRTFALRAVRDHGVASIPVSAFYAEDPVRHILRLCFAKADDTLDEAVRRLAAARG